MELYESEHEQVEALKRWWEKNGKYVIAALVAVIVGILGWRQWQSHQESQAREASDAYQQMVNNSSDPAKAMELGRAVVANYPKSEYAVLASLVMGAAAVMQDDLDGAAAHLRFAMENGKAPGDKQVAALRLARVLLAQKKGKEAQQLLDGVKPEGFEGEFDEVRGDIALSLGDRVTARNDYQKALTNYANQPTKSRLVQMKLDDLADAVGSAK